AEELLALHQRLAGSGGGAAERGELLELVGLADARDRRIEAMSKGMRQRLGTGRITAAAPAGRADERARPGRQTHGAAAAGGAAEPRHLGPAQLPPAERGRARLRPRRDPAAR